VTSSFDNTLKQYEYYEDTPVDHSPFVNPYDPSHQKPDLLAGNLAGHLAGLYRAPEPTKRPLLPNVKPTLPVDRTRFFPPGELKFDRFADGFNFKFRSQK